jgi:ABC-type antimicrobial peptide transport system permease subunit
MTELSVLWLPILLSAAIVFVVSSVIHMLSPWHKSDYPQAPNEDKLRDAVRPLNIPPGDYMVPRAATREELRTPEFAAKMNVLIASGFARMMSSLLFQVTANDPLAFAGAIALISVVAGCACFFPALRATKVDPAVALREE